MFPNNTSYSSGMEGTLYRRIRSPHEHDVLSGRGGSINSHSGNIRFREWVRVRKNDYNLAPTKAEKARVAQEVIDLVRGQEPSGRFLQKDPTHVGMGGWWVEIDEERVMAKTSQALREGAPQIRAAHRHTPIKTKSGRKSVRKPVVPSATTAPARTPALVSSSVGGGSTLSKRLYNASLSEEAIKQLHANVLEAQLRQQQQDIENVPQQPYSYYLPVQEEISSAVEPASKRVRVEYNGHTVLPTDDTPPLTASSATQHPEFGEPPVLDLMSIPSPRKPLSQEDRTNSLALTEFSNTEEWSNEDFVNPFENETYMFDQQHEPEIHNGTQSLLQDASVRDSSSSAASIPSPKPGVFRESSTASDMGGLGALLKDDKIMNLEQSGVRSRDSSMSSLSSSRYAYLDDDDLYQDSDPLLPFVPLSPSPLYYNDAAVPAAQ